MLKMQSSARLPGAGRDGDCAVSDERRLLIVPDLPRPSAHIDRPKRVRVAVELILRTIRVTKQQPVSDHHVMKRNACPLCCTRHGARSSHEDSTRLRRGRWRGHRRARSGSCRCRRCSRGDGWRGGWPHSRHSCRRATCCEGNGGDHSADDGCEFHVCLHPFNGNALSTVTSTQMRRKSSLR